MRHVLTMILALGLPFSIAFAKDIAPNTGNIKLNGNDNMHVVIGDNVGCWPGYFWHPVYGGCRMRGANIAENALDICRPEYQFIGTRTRSRYREQWILQGSEKVELGPWGVWQSWDERDCKQKATCLPHECANRAHLHAYSMEEGQGGGESLTPVLAYVQCTLYRNNSVLIDRHIFIHAMYFHKNSLQANHGAHACNQVVAEIQAWGIVASIDYASIDWNATMGWARVNYW